MNKNEMAGHRLQNLEVSVLFLKSHTDILTTAMSVQDILSLLDEGRGYIIPHVL